MVRGGGRCRNAFKANDEELRSLFVAIDRRKEGELERDDLGSIFSKIGIDVSPLDLHHLFRELDVDDSGKLSFKEFAEIGSRIYNDVHKYWVNREVFVHILGSLFTKHEDCSWEDAGEVALRRRSSFNGALASLQDMITVLVLPDITKRGEITKPNAVSVMTSSIDLQPERVKGVLMVFGEKLSAKKSQAACDFMRELCNKERLPGLTEEGTVVDIRVAAEVLLGQLTVEKYGDRSQHSDLLPNMHDAEGLAVWRTLVRRFVLVDEVHKRATRTIMLYGRRVMDNDVEMRRHDEREEAEKRRCFFFPDSAFKFRWCSSPRLIAPQ